MVVVVVVVVVVVGVVVVVSSSSISIVVKLTEKHDKNHATDDKTHTKTENIHPDVPQ